MEAHRTQPGSGLDSQISTLLDRVSKTTSVVDRLMAMPVPDNDEIATATHWDRAVVRQLERQLVQMMRENIGDEPAREHA